jgi:hypothetical protein
MSIDVAAELWGELKRYVNTVDRDEAAEAVVSVLVDNDHDADEIRTAFKGDSDIKKALATYLGNNEIEEDIEEDIEDDDYEHDWED